MTNAGQPDDLDAGAQMLASISNEIVSVYKEVFGRGPTRARTNWAGQDTIVVTLEDTFTHVERNLRTLGEEKRLHDLRLFLQHESIHAFCEPIERLTGRRVRGFISGIDPREDIGAEIFLLHPPGYDGPSRMDAL